MAMPIVVTSSGFVLRTGNTYFFKTSVAALSAVIAFVTDPSTIELVDIDGNCGINNITLTTQQGNKFVYNGQLDTELIVDVNGWNGQLQFDNLDFLWTVNGARNA